MAWTSWKVIPIQRKTFPTRTAYSVYLGWGMLQTWRSIWLLQGIAGARIPLKYMRAKVDSDWGQRQTATDIRRAEFKNKLGLWLETQGGSQAWINRARLAILVQNGDALEIRLSREVLVTEGFHRHDPHPVENQALFSLALKLDPKLQSWDWVYGFESKSATPQKFGVISDVRFQLGDSLITMCLTSVIAYNEIPFHY